MAESQAMQPEGTAVESPLDKPLNQLTEDDIAQLTREDCRRYLKEKGMRRPSWNKSQAIQQVIMLKRLFETTTDSHSGSGKRPFSRPNSTHNNSNNMIHESAPRETCGDVENAAVGTAPYHRKDLDKPDSSSSFSARFATANNDSALSRTTDSTNILVGQMTIFYCGKVNVYDDVPANKARSIMHMAASTVQFPNERQVDGNVFMQPLPFVQKASSAKACLGSAAHFLPRQQTAKMHDSSPVLEEESNLVREEAPGVEGPAKRKASVQRFLNKRKDRFRSKRKTGLSSCSSQDMYFHPQTGNQIPSEPLSRRETCSPPQIRPPSTPKRCSSVDNDSVKNFCASTNLNN